MNAPSRRPGTIGSGVTLLLLLLLLAVNAAAVWSLVATRRSARRLATEDLEWQTRAHARAIEASLSGLRGDLILLAQSSPVADALPRLAGEEPVARRWGRLDVEGTLLLFLEAHPGVDRLALRPADGPPALVAGRRDGVPVLLPPGSDLATREEGERLAASWPLGRAGEEAGFLDAVIDPRGVLATALPGFEGRVWLGAGEPATGFAAASPADRGRSLVARATVVSEDWEPPLAWNLVRREEESLILRSIEATTGRLGTTVVTNVVVVALTFALVLLAFRQARDRARLAAEAEYQTRLRELERQVLHNERLASIGRLAAGMAHEINNPLEGMSNYLRLLEDDLAAGETAEAPQFAGKVREGLERIAGITRQVLTFASPGKAPKGPVELGPLVRANVDFLRQTPAFRHIEWSVELPAEPLVVNGNPTTLNQLLLNLLLNACQVQPPAVGSSTAGGRVEVAGARQGARVRLAVADRGPGLDAETLAHVFEPFFSTRGSTGLGLAACHGIALDHGGGIEVHNRDGGGARFEVELPLQQGNAQEGNETA